MAALVQNVSTQAVPVSPVVEQNVLASVYRVTQAAKNEFQTNAGFFTVYEVGAKALNEAVDRFFDALSLKFLDPRYIAEVGTTVTNRGLDVVRTPLGAAWSEIRGTVDVVGYVNQARTTLQIPDLGEIPLQAALERARAAGDFPAVWLIEGLGEVYTERAVSLSKPIRDLWSGAEIPASSLAMLHAGSGITFAKRALGTITPYSKSSEIGRALEGFLEQAKATAQPGYLGPIIESLGLVTRTWFQEMVKPVMRSLKQIDAVATEYFWHGAGRAMYFSPVNKVPGFSPWRSVEIEAPDEKCRQNARAGVAWAYTLVNLRDPSLMADCLVDFYRERARGPGFLNGVLSSLIMASEVVPEDRFVKAFCEYRPPRCNRSRAEAWERYFGNGLKDKVERYRLALIGNGRLGEIFRQQSLAELVRDRL